MISGTGGPRQRKPVFVPRATRRARASSILRWWVEGLAVAAALAALYYTVVQTHITNVALQQQQLMSAYQLMGMPGISGLARWKGALFALSVDGELSGFNNGCRPVDESQAFERCVAHTDLVIDGRSSGVFWTFYAPVLNQEDFQGGEMRNVMFRSGEMSRAMFQQNVVSDAAFLDMVMRGTLFAPKLLTKGRQPFAAVFTDSDLEDSVFMDDYSGLLIQLSNISGTFFPKGASNATFQNNYYVQGQAPVVGEDEVPSLAEWVCSRRLKGDESMSQSGLCQPVARITD